MRCAAGNLYAKSCGSSPACTIIAGSASNTSSRPCQSMEQSTPKYSRPNARAISRNALCSGGANTSSKWVRKNASSSRIHACFAHRRVVVVDHPVRRDRQMIRIWNAVDDDDAVLAIVAVVFFEIHERHHVEMRAPERLADTASIPPYRRCAQVRVRLAIRPGARRADTGSTSRRARGRRAPGAAFAAHETYGMSAMARRYSRTRLVPSTLLRIVDEPVSRVGATSRRRKFSARRSRPIRRSR